MRDLKQRALNSPPRKVLAVMARKLHPPSAGSHVSIVYVRPEKLRTYTKATLIDICEGLQLKVSGTKEDLIQRIWKMTEKDVIENEEWESWTCSYCEESIGKSDMIMCDKCKNWVHFKCANINSETVPKGDWYCKFCTPK